MAEPNRLRDQAIPNAAAVGVRVADGSPGPAPATWSAVAASPGVVGPAVQRTGWTTRRMLVVGIVGELTVLIVVALAGAIGQGMGGVVPAWIAGHGVLGVVLGRAGGGRRRFWTGLAAVILAAVVAGVCLTAAVLLGAGDDGLRAAGPLAIATEMLLGTALLVIFLGLPIVAVGVVVGRIPSSFRRRDQIRAVASGLQPLVQPIEPLERKTRATSAMDDAELAKATAGGAATRIVRIYPWTGGDEILAADTARLAAIGYLATKVERRPPTRGLRLVFAVLAGLVLIVLALLLDFVGTGFGDFDFASTGRITATFDLVASDHHPVPVNPDI